jgi:hypothetical protein
MARNSCTFIVVPDAKSQCKRYVIPNFVFYLLGVLGVVLLVVLSIVIHSMLGEYRAVSQKMAQLQKLKKVSLSQNSTIDRYEEDIVQLSKNLSHIEQLNSRLMILTGLDPEGGENNLGLGGPEDGNLKVEEQNSEDDDREK